MFWRVLGWVVGCGFLGERFRLGRKRTDGNRGGGVWREEGWSRLVVLYVWGLYGREKFLMGWEG